MVGGRLTRITQILKCCFDQTNPDQNALCIYSPSMNINFIISLPEDLSPPQDEMDCTDRDSNARSPLLIPPFLSASYHRIFAMCNSSIYTCGINARGQCRSNGRDREGWRGPHTALVMGPEGSGKSLLLDLLIFRLQQQGKCIPTIPPMTVLRVSGKNLCDSLAAELSSREVLEESESLRLLVAVKRVVMLLSKTSWPAFGYLKAWEKKIVATAEDSSDASAFPPLVLLLEDMDDVFRLSSTRGEDRALQSDTVTRLQNALTHFLAILTAPNFDMPVCLVASTSLTESTVSSKFLASSGFEVVVSVPQPSTSDRKTIIANILQGITCGNIDQRTNSYELGDIPAAFDAMSKPDISQHEVFGEHDVLQAWAMRCARMTAGYLPGDLRILLRRMVSIREGKKMLAFSDKSVHCVLEWEDFLAALATTAPRQLMNLHSGDGDIPGLSGVVVEGRNSLMHWSQFAGYESAKKTVRLVIDRISASGSKKLDITLI